ncbi:MAG: maleylacetoacetate isomerase [Pseudomonadota bacterium]
MQFYGYFRSSCAYRCRIAFNLKGVEYEFASVHLRKNGGEHKTPAFLEINPQGLLPAIVDGPFALNQSLAIVEWLDEKHPSPAFLPDSPEGRAHVRAFSQMIACDIHPLQNLRVLQYLGNEFGADQSVKDKWCQRWLGDGLAACEAVIARQETKTKYCFGDTPGLADICLVPQVFSAHRFSVDMSEMPNLNRIYESCQELDAFADAAPGKQPDAEA